jgi:hypothetical protein
VAVRDELRHEAIQLIDGLPEEELVVVVRELRGRAELHMPAVLMTGQGQVTAPQSPQQSKFVLRWPHLGPGTFGAAVLGGWILSYPGGLPLALGGAVLGALLGDQLDQHNAAAASSSES